MTLRIDVVAAEDPPTIVLSGWLSKAEVAEFERQKRSGAVLGASPYVGLLLDSADEAEREK